MTNDEVSQRIHCPTCGVKPGEPCREPVTSQPREHPHIARQGRKGKAMTNDEMNQRIHALQITRTDCIRDGVGVHLPRASTLGFGRYKAKPGNWVRWHSLDEAPDDGIGRVIGRVQVTSGADSGKEWVEVAALLGGGGVYVRWVRPEDIVECYPTPPFNALRFLMGDFSDPVEVMRQMKQGLPTDREWLESVR
jgi:hypothetical protein